MTSMDRADLCLTMTEFRETFADHDGFHTIASTIVDLLMANLDEPDHPNHPLHTYGRDAPVQTIMEELCEDVRAVCDGPLIHAFFHRGGVYSRMLASVMDEYWNYIDLVNE
jgi:hypothetical protein